MEFKQCIFRTYDGEPDAELPGIAVYKYGNLIGVICLCCGSWCSAKRTKILAVLPGWIDLAENFIRTIECADEWDDEEDD